MIPSVATLVGICRLVAYALWTLPLMPVQAMLVALGLPARAAFPRWYHRTCLPLLGLKVVVRGTSSAVRPTLIVANHVSYLDIPVLSALVPASFVAKAEVERWPFFGLLARLQRTVFIERTSRRQAHRQRDDMRQRLSDGDILVLFPEGTSSDGNRVLPFKTALFAVASLEVDGRPLTVQPVSLTPTRLDGIPLGYGGRPIYAWFGDRDLAPHLWEFLRAGKMTVEVTFHEPVTLAQFPSRKAMAEHCQRAVAAGVAAAIAGRGGDPVPAPDVPADRPSAASPAAARTEDRRRSA